MGGEMLKKLKWWYFYEVILPQSENLAYICKYNGRRVPMADACLMKEACAQWLTFA